MKRLCLSIAIAVLGLPAAAGTQVGVSVAVDQPGFYGRVDIGSVPVRPVLVYPQPVVVVSRPVAVVQQPIYLHVPPGQAKHWRKHCAAYNACGQPVYFVQEGWYQRYYGGKHGHSGKHKHKHKHKDD
jgi:hypothetical protein